MADLSIIIKALLEGKDLNNQVKKLQSKITSKLPVKLKIDGNDVADQLRKLSGQIKQKLQVKLEIDAADLEVLTRKAKQTAEKIGQTTKQSLKDATKGLMYEKVEEQVRRLNEQIKKNGGQMVSWTADVNAKTKEITGATIQYADSLGRVKTEIYKIKEEYQKIVDSKGNPKAVLASVELEKVTDKYSQNVSKQQTDLFNKAKGELNQIVYLQKEKIKLNKEDVEYAQTLDKQLAKHKNNYQKILNTQIDIGEEVKVNGLSEQQIKELKDLRIKQEEEIERLLKKQRDAQARTTSTTTSGMRSLGDEVDIGGRVNLNASREELKRYAEAVAGVGAEWTKLTPKQDKLGNKMVEVGVRIKDGTDKWRNYTMTLDETSGKLYKIDRGLSDVTNRQLSIGEKFKTALQIYPIWLAATTITMQTIHAIQNAIKYIHEMDDAVTSLSKVVEFSNEQLKDMTKSAIDLGKELGKSSVEIMKGMAEFGRVTKDMHEIIELTRVATMASNVTDLSVAEAAKALTSSMINFQIAAKDSMQILDQWNELQNNFRVSAEDLASAIGQVGSVARQSGTSIQSLEGYVTALTSSMGISGDEAGTALKSMMSRVFRLGSEGEEDAGKAEEYLKKLGVAVRDSVGNFRSFSDILTDTQTQFKGLTNVQQIALAQVVGGTHHYSKFISLMNAWDIVTKATATAINSQNSAIEENRKYLESITGRIATLKTSWEDFANSILSSDMFKVLITGLSGVVEGLNTTAGKIALTVSTVTLITMAIITFKKQLIAASAAVKGFFTSLGPVGWITLIISTLTPIVLSLANAFETASEKQAKALEELSVGYNDVKTKLIELQSELDQTISRIEVLNNQDKLSFVEETELEKLQGVTIELQRQIDKEEALKRLRGEALERATLEASNNRTEKSAYPFDTLSGILTPDFKIPAKGTMLTIGEKLKEDMAVVDQYTRLLWNLQYQYDQGEISAETFAKAETKIINERKSFIESLNLMIQKLKEQNDNLVGATESGKKQKASNLEMIASAEKLLIAISGVNTALETNKDMLGIPADPPVEATEDFTKSLEAAEKALDKYNATIDRLQSAYGDLWDITDKMNAGTKLTGNEVVDLIQKYPELISALEKTENGYLINVQAIDLLKQSQIDEMNLAQQIAVDRQIAIVNSSLAIAESYGIQVEAIQSLADAEAQLKSGELLLGLDPSKFDLASGMYGSRNISDLGLSEEGQKLLYQKVNIAKAVLEIGKLREQAKALQDITSDPNFGKNTNSGKGTEIYTAQLEVYRELNNELEKINNALSENQRLVDTTEGVEQNKHLEDRVQLLNRQRDALTNLNKEQENQLNIRKKELSSLGFTFSGNDITNYATRLPQLTDEAAKKAEKLVSEFDALAIQKIPQTTYEISKIGDEIDSIGKTIEESLTKKMEEAGKKVEDVFGQYYDYLFHKMNEEIELLEDQKDAYDRVADARIKSLKDQIAILEKVNAIEKEQEERQKRIDDIQKQKQVISNLENEKIKMYQDGKWVYVADPRKMREETDRLKEMETDFAKWESDLAHKKKIDSLQQQIETIEEERRIHNEAIAYRISSMQTFMQNQQDLIAGTNNFQIMSMEALKESLIGIDAEMYAERLRMLENFLVMYNSMLPQSNTNFIGNPTLTTSGVPALKTFENQSITLNPVINMPTLSLPAFQSGVGSGIVNHYHFDDLTVNTPDATNFIKQLELIARTR